MVAIEISIQCQQEKTSVARIMERMGWDEEGVQMYEHWQKQEWDKKGISKSEGDDYRKS